MRKWLVVTYMIALQSFCAYGQALNIEHTPEEYDAFIATWKENNKKEYFETITNDYVSLDTSSYIEALSHITETQFKERLNSIVSPVHLPYNDVIHKRLVAYTTTHKATTRRMLSASQYYFPIIERELDKAEIPLELKFLPMIESSMQPMAISPSGAAGLWQLMLNTGRHYGLEINSMVDERLDPVKSTEAACKYLKDLYKIYNDWTLVIASYNFGPGNVNKAIRRAGSGTKTYWDIYPYLPKVTRDYIPAFVGLTYIYNYHTDHNIKPASTILPMATDTVMIDRNLNFDQITATIGISTELLQILNPQYKKQLIPGQTKPYILILPQKEISAFLDNLNSIYAKEGQYIDPKYNTSTTPVKSTEAVSSYKVVKGDTLGAIAKKHKVTVKQLQAWNNMNNTNLSIGQVIKINN